jgi:hypothetical protein
MGRKGESITLSLKEYEKEALEHLAREYGLMWGDRPNLSKLLKAIAEKKLLIAANNDWSIDRISALNSIRKILVDVGQIDGAQLIAQILCDRSEINNPLRREIETFLGQEIPIWRQEIDNLINRNQPFKLIYQDASDRLLQFTILYGRIQFIEKRFYLLCRCEETEGNNDIEELKQNRSLKLDRIKEAEIIKIERKWENNLQQVPIEFHLFKGLISNYESRPEDVSISVEETEKNQLSKKVIRNVSQTFWFFREIAQYWENCQIVSPENVRQKFIEEKLQSLNRLYDFTE